MQPDAFTHAFQLAIFFIQEFTQGSDRLDTYLQSCGKLDSNEEFTTNDTFTVNDFQQYARTR